MICLPWSAPASSTRCWRPEIPRFVWKLAERRSGKAKTGEEAECRGLHEHSEPVLNAAWSKRRQFAYRT
ncbi:hypothetical protein FW796_15620 [Pseudomonas sp. 910_21]